MNYIDHSLIVIFTITEGVSISAFVSLVGITIGTGSAIRWILCIITAGTKKYKSIIKKNKKKHDKIVLIAKFKLNRVEVLISTTLIDSNISRDEFVLINNALKELNDTKEKSKIPVTNKSLKYIQNNVTLLFEV